MNRRCGLLGIVLPDHPDYNRLNHNPYLIPPRLADNCDGDDSYAHTYDWRGAQSASIFQDRIHQAFTRRRRQPEPDNGRHPFARNWNRPKAHGWSD